MMDIRIRQFNGSKYYVSDSGEVFKKINPYETNKGYLNVKLYLPGKTLTTGVHRLVARLFLNNPYELDQVNHKDEDKKNNCVDNLEWCSSKYNANYGTRVERMARGHSKPIYSLDLSGRPILKFISIAAASTYYGIDSSSITKALKDKRLTAGGYRWKYDERGN